MKTKPEERGGLRGVRALPHRLVVRLISAVGVTLFVSIATWAYFNTNYQEHRLMESVIASTDRLTNTIRLGTHYAMMLNSRDDITQIISNIGTQPEIRNIRIYNKQGEIKFSNRLAEVDTRTNIKAEACDICHRTVPPLVDLDLSSRTRILQGPGEPRRLGIISPIYNEPGCSSGACHIHPEGKKILGALDVVVSLSDTDRELALGKRAVVGLTAAVFLLTSVLLAVMLVVFVNRPVQSLIAGTRRIAEGLPPGPIPVHRKDEMGQLARAIETMSLEIAQKQGELTAQREEYQTLFENVPCLITLQDRNFRLLRFNREFAKRFAPREDDTCYRAYKGREEPCPRCPVALTFEDGLPHQGEESGVNKDGSVAHWIFRTTPIHNRRGEVVAALEMSLDITERKQLEEQLARSEKKYHEIFNHIPNPVFVLDARTFEVIDCNRSVTTVYGHTREEVLRRSFLDFFFPEERESYRELLPRVAELNQVKHRRAGGERIFVNIRLSPGEFPGREVLLVTTSDITKRLETEQQLIQASKMATLGEMATGIAHELNQPLSVIKTASSFFVRKLDERQTIDEATLAAMLRKIDANVDRAARIINHLRQFARKSELKLERIQVNDVLRAAFDVFSQQLKLRQIEVAWETDPDLPKIDADPGRLEQVFINLLINARDAIEERWAGREAEAGAKRIHIAAYRSGRSVVCEIRDTGPGVPPHLAERIFEPFFTTKQAGEGTGLGLSISYGIIKDCRGTIRVKPAPEGGACFVIEFPLPEKEHG
ncbi:MAG: PAS domain S-box protein [Desulfobacterales bacterium]